ncbi:MAG: hypothetical protein J6V50_01360 [Clostridia bacterium]|nr:hypothetical protein [Clostridia bacterium]
MVSSTLVKRLAIVILSAILICSFVACKKKEPDVDVAPSSSNSTGSVNSTVSVENDTEDEGEELNSSELDKLEGDTLGNTSSSFKPLPGVSSRPGSSSTPGYTTNGPGVVVPVTPSSSESSTSSEAPATSSSASSTEATSSEATSSEATSSKKPSSIPDDGFIPDWF